MANNKTIAFAGNLLLLLFNNTALANIGDASGLQPSATAGSFYISLHTASPTTSGNQTTNETSYGSYARQAVARSAGGWTCSTNTVTNTAAITFPALSSGGPVTITHFGVGTASSGAGNLLYFGALTSSKTLDTGDSLVFAINDLDGSEN